MSENTRTPSLLKINKRLYPVERHQRSVAEKAVGNIARLFSFAPSHKNRTALPPE